MNQELKQINPEFSKPGLNPFLVAMAQSKSPTEITPVQQLAAELRGLEKIAQAGDLKAWQEQFPRVEAALEQLQAEPMRRLEIQVQIKQAELTLFLKASKRALVEAQAEEKSAREAEIAETGAAREHWAKAQKWKRLGEHFQGQLQAQLKAA